MPTILDLGCGTGVNYRYLARRGTVYGLELEEENVKEAARRYPGGHFTVGLAEKLPYEDRFFDEIHCYDVSEHVDDLEQSMAEIDRTLKPGGLLVIEVPNPRSERFLLRLRPGYWEEIHHRRMFEPSEMAKLWRDKNFRPIRTVRKKGIENVVLGFYFLLNIGIANQNGAPKYRWTRYINLAAALFNEDLMKRDWRWIFLAWPFLAVGKLLTFIFPKTIHYEFRKTKKKT